MRQRLERLDELGVELVVVSFESAYFARVYAEETDTPWPVLLDTEGALYAGYGMDRASLRDVWGPATLWRYLTLLLRGRKPQRSEGDVQQRGGDVLIDPEGRLRLVYVGRNPADRPPVDSILALVGHQE